VVPSTEPCTLRSTQPLKMSTRDFSWGKGGRWVWLTTYHPCSAETSRKSEALTYPEPLWPPRPVAGDLYLYFTLQVLQVWSNSRIILRRQKRSTWGGTLSQCLFMQNKAFTFLERNSGPVLKFALRINSQILVFSNKVVAFFWY